MRTFDLSPDLSPLFRHSVGFDRMQRLLDSASQWDSGTPSYPPYNIEQVDEDSYRITMAVAGFGHDNLEITSTENTLVVSGKLSKNQDAETKLLHRGIAGRAFERRFELADHIKVTGADLVNGLLHIDLVREVPEEKKPRKIAISTTAIEHKKAA